MLKVIEIVFVFFAVILIATQILWPTVCGTLLFPLFRKTGKLEHDLAEANQEQTDLRLSQEVQKVRDAVAAEKAKIAKAMKK